MIILLFLLIVAVIFFPYIRIAVGRFCFFRKIKKQCALKKYYFKLNKPFSALFRNFSDVYDFTVDTGKTVYAVKLWDEVYKHSSILFGADRRVYSRRKIQNTFGEGNKRTHKISERELGTFSVPKAQTAEKRSLVCILAVSSEKIKLFYSDNEGMRELRVKDRLYGMFILPRRGLLKLFDRIT